MAMDSAGGADANPGAYFSNRGKKTVLPIIIRNITQDEVYDNYPADRLMHDIALALMATQTQTTEVLDTFPTIPAVQEAERILGSAENPEVTIPQEA